MDKLPSEIIINILSRLPIKPLLCCRCVCKSWLNLTYDSQHINTHLHQSSQNEDNLSLIFLSYLLVTPTTYCRNQLSFMHNNGGTDHNYTCVDLNLSMPNLDKFEVVGSCNGLLCLFDPFARILRFICNPCNGEYAPLPNPIKPSSSPTPIDIAVGFGYVPQRKVYKVIEIVYYKRTIFNGDSKPEVHVLTLGDRSWRHKGYASFPRIYGVQASQAFVNGALHWLDHRPGLDYIVSFDVADEQYGVIPHPEFESRQPNYRLGVLRGCLSVANDTYRKNVEMWVMNKYGVKESWAKLFKVDCSEVGFGIEYVWPLDCWRSSKVLVFRGSCGMFCYDPTSRSLREISIARLPQLFRVFTHVGSLVSPLLGPNLNVEVVAKAQR